MGTYNISAEEIADFLEEHNLEDIEGDFTEDTLLRGVRLFCKRMRKNRASIPKK